MDSVVADLHRIELDGVNAYLWTGSGGPTLIDTGYPWTIKKLETALRNRGLTPRELKRIIITHADIDHIGGLKHLAEASNAIICCHAAEVALVQRKRLKPRARTASGLLTRPLVLIINRYYQPGVDRVNELVIEGKKTPEGFTILHTPGHAPGHISLYHADTGVLITGDALANREGKLGLPPIAFTPDLPGAIESLQKFIKLDFETVCFGHGPPLKENAHEQIVAFVKNLHR